MNLGNVRLSFVDASSISSLDHHDENMNINMDPRAAPAVAHFEVLGRGFGVYS